MKAPKCNANFVRELQLFSKTYHKGTSYSLRVKEVCESEVKVAQLFPTLCDPIDYTVHGILQARMLEWVAFPFLEDLPNPGIKPRSPTLQVDSLSAEPEILYSKSMK